MFEIVALYRRSIISRALALSLEIHDCRIGENYISVTLFASTLLVMISLIFIIMAEKLQSMGNLQLKSLDINI